MTHLMTSEERLGTHINRLEKSFSNWFALQANDLLCRIEVTLYGTRHLISIAMKGLS